MHSDTGSPTGVTAAARIRTQRAIRAAFAPFARRWYMRRYGADSGSMAFDEWAECGPLLFWRPCQCEACRRARKVTR